MEVVKYTAIYKESWDQLIDDSVNGSFFFKRDFMEYHQDRFEDASLIAFENEKVVAVLPASIENGVVTSHGGLTFGGVITRNGCKTVSIINVLDAIVSYYQSLGVSKFVYKAIPSCYKKAPSDDDVYKLTCLGAQLIRRDLSSVVCLTDDVVISKSRKRDSKNARKKGVEVRESQDFDEYWRILEATLKERHGVAAPVHTVDEIKRLACSFPNNIKLFGAYLNDVMISGSVMFINDTVAHTQYLASSPEGRSVGGMDLLLYELILNHFAHKKWFSFGISTEDQGKVLNVGLISHKEKFGAGTIVHDHYGLNLK